MESMAAYYFFKKQKPLAYGIVETSKQLRVPGIGVFNDEVKAMSSGWSRKTVQMRNKLTGCGFKIRYICA